MQRLVACVVHRDQVLRRRVKVLDERRAAAAVGEDSSHSAAAQGRHDLYEGSRAQRKAP